MAYHEQKCPECIIGQLRIITPEISDVWDAWCLWCGFFESGRIDD